MRAEIVIYIFQRRHVDVYVKTTFRMLKLSCKAPPLDASAGAGLRRVYLLQPRYLKASETDALSTLQTHSVGISLRLDVKMTSVFVALLGFLWGFYLAGSSSVLDGSELQPNFMHRRLRTQEKREMQKEILSILGLNHRPRPHLNSGKYNSAPLFMLDLYNSMSTEEKSDVDQYRSLFTTTRPALASLHDAEFLHDSDMVMSFVNSVNTDLINGGSIRVQDSLVYVNFPLQGPGVAQLS
ncbi:Bone morphogenetic protein 7 [Labeo rohita]|uniref:Bone morphogenetic protein 7 n=1 Tax=Labeo rohita TaxID=84645 RepID=A0ABQ8LFS1_LABRO|nr:Bone morphogenetic protein 7 [Labeo rohita]